MRSACCSVSVALALAMVTAGVPNLRGEDVPLPPALAEGIAPAEPKYTSHPDPSEVAADALIVRPAGLAATILGAAIYVVALPFAAIAGDVKTTGRALVGAPARFTFKRPLGDFGARQP